MRINKFMADSGVDSRRNCDRIIEEGRVTVNGKPALFGMEIDPLRDDVRVDGTRIEQKSKDEYYIVHKPKGYICTSKDEHGRRTVMDLVTTSARVYPIGRLDYDTEGLVLLTTDGELTNRLTHPRFEIPKTYIVRIEGAFSPAELQKIRTGIIIDGKSTGKCRARLLDAETGARLEITVTEGRNQNVRKMMETLGKTVTFLKCDRVGDLRLGNLPRGMSRPLSASEILYLKGL